MAHQDLSGTGIVTGQTVEASQVTQFVNAFTGQPVSGKGYDITISGSLNLTGSLLMTGSLINEFTGQFSALGIGVAAPTAPTMLHIKDTAVGGDPIVLLEANTGTDNARIRFQNPDVSYDVGAYGSSGDDFMIVQDQNGTPKFQFIIGKNEPSYALQIRNGVVGSGMGAGFNSNPSNLPDGSIQASATISGSLLSGGVISASAAGPTANIHGTASWASNVITSATASYTKLGSIDMSGGNTSAYSASGIFNSTFNIVSNGGRVEGTNLRYKTAIQDTTGDDIIKGSVASANLKIGDPEAGGGGDGPIIEFNTTDNKTFFKTNNQNNNDVHIKGNLTASEDIRISGSASPSLVVGPPTGIPGSNNPSASLFHESLKFYKAGQTIVANYATTSGANLILSAGGTVGDDTAALRISSSKDVTSNKKLILRQYASDASVIQTGMLQQGVIKSDDRGNKLEHYVIPQYKIAQGASDYVYWTFNPPASLNSFYGPYMFAFEVSLFVCGDASNNEFYVYNFQRMFKKAQGTNGVITRLGVRGNVGWNQNGGLLISTDPDLAVNGNNIELTIGSASTGGSATYSGYVKVFYNSFDVNPDFS